MTTNSHRQAVKDALIWEFFWIPIEMICVAIGLWITLKLQWGTVGSLWFVAFLMIDYIVRYRHYSKVAPQIHGSQLES